MNWPTTLARCTILKATQRQRSACTSTAMVMDTDFWLVCQFFSADFVVRKLLCIGIRLESRDGLIQVVQSGCPILCHELQPCVELGTFGIF